MDQVEFEIAPEIFVGGTKPIFIIAEISQNHLGSYAKARELIKIASECKVHCVNFQKMNLRRRFTQAVLNEPYESEQGSGSTFGEHMRRLELSEDNFMNLKRYAEEQGLVFTGTGMDEDSIDFLDRIGVPFFKIASADAGNLPFLNHVAEYKKPVVISTGIQNEETVVKVYTNICRSIKNIAIMQCTSCYPTPPCNANLNVIKTYQRLFPRAVIGYSGREEGCVESLAAVGAGAKIIERLIKHGDSRGCGNPSALSPADLMKFVKDVQKTEASMGQYEKQFEECEAYFSREHEKTIVSTRFLARGTILTEADMTVKVSGRSGEHPIYFYQLVGRRLKEDTPPDEPIMETVRSDEPVMLNDDQLI